MEKWTREEKLTYYFWLDNLVLHHWAEYMDLKLEENEDNTALCETKLELINYYQDELDEVGKEFTWEELDEWYRNKYGSEAPFIRFCKDFFMF